MKKIVLLAVVFLVFSASVFASKLNVEINIPKGSIYDGIGIGIIAGAPSGLSVKKFLTHDTAIQGNLSWYYYGAFGLSFDYLIHNFDIIKVEKGELGLYFGPGVFLSMYYMTYYGYTSGGFGAGLRVPLGACYQFENYPIDIFVEVAPSLNVSPAVIFGFGGGVGARYYF